VEVTRKPSGEAVMTSTLSLGAGDSAGGGGAAAGLSAGGGGVLAPQARAESARARVEKRRMGMRILDGER
jgi:hypothetical protein